MIYSTMKLLLVDNALIRQKTDVWAGGKEAFNLH